MKANELAKGLIVLAGLGMLGDPLAGAPAESAQAPAGERTAALAKKRPRIILGRVEYVVVRDVDLKFKARIDTGAGLSSVHARILEIRETDDGELVRFQIVDGEVESKIIEREIVGWVNIKMMGTDEKNRRPIVKLHICLGGKRLYGRVNLNDRSEFLYPMLIGRNLLNTGKFLVDPSRRFLADPGCEPKSKE